MGDFENTSFIVSKMLRNFFCIDRKRDKETKDEDIFIVGK